MLSAEYQLCDDEEALYEKRDYGVQYVVPAQNIGSMYYAGHVHLLTCMKSEYSVQPVQRPYVQHLPQVIARRSILEGVYTSRLM